MDARAARLLVLGVVAVGVVVAVGWLRKSGPSRAFDALSYPHDGGVVPAQEMADEGLPLRTAIERQPRARKVRLELERGAALLVLDDAPEQRTADLPMAFGRGTLTATDCESGAAFVAAIAKWLETPVPPPKSDPTPLEPVRISFVRLGTTEGGKPEAMKLFLQTRKLEAEVYLNLMSDGKSATMLEKDEDYRKDLVAFLALALRDGPPLRRSAKTDASLASDEPLLHDLPPLPGKAGRFMFTDDGTLLGSEASSLLRWSDPTKEPASVTSFDAEVFDIKPQPHGALVAVTLIQTKTPGAYSTGDPEWVALWDPATGTKSELGRRTDGASTSGWSPDGKLLALRQHTTAKPSKSFVRIYDPTSKRVVAATEPELDVSFEEWSAKGLLLKHDDYSSDDGGADRFYLWQGTATPPVPTSGRAPSFSSPDAHFEVTVGADTVEVREKPSGTTKKFRAKSEDDADALEALRESAPQFIGPHGLSFHAEELFVLDLETLKLQRLIDREGFAPQAVSSDGRRIVLRGDRGVTLYARLP